MPSSDPPAFGADPTLGDRSDRVGESTVAILGDSVFSAVDDGFPELDDLAGRTLSQYRLGEVVGQGSMSRVYQAEHLTLFRPCALKILNPGLLARQPDTREHFWAEARVVANLVHPNIVTVHNLGSDRGYHFIEMEYVDGASLRDILIREGPLDSFRASTIVHQVVQALGKAHDSGLVHRDIKPTNVMIAKSGQAKLADFGLVRHLKELQLAGATVGGTPTFMAPELFGGSSASPHSDLYAVGVMYYYLLSSRLPFASDTIAQLIKQHLNHPIPDVREIVSTVSEDVHLILNRCMAKQPKERFESAAELSEALRSVINSLQNTGELLQEALQGIDCFIQGGLDNYRVVFRLPQDRIQEVYLEVTTGRHNERLLSVFSVCGPADPSHFEFALKLNAHLTYGGLTVREVNGQAHAPDPPRR